MKGAIQLPCNRNNNCNNRRHHCGCMRMARGCWGNFPYYGGGCPDVYGCYGRRPWEDCDNNDNDNDERDRGNDCECRCRRCRRRRRRCGGGMPNVMLTSFAPLAVSPNGIIPLSMADICRNSDFEVNSGLITVESEGTYLATYNVRVPAQTALDTVMTLNVNDASQTPAITQVVTEAGANTTSFTAQAIFQADEGDTVSLRTSEAINVTETSVQPMVTLSLTRLEE